MKPRLFPSDAVSFANMGYGMINAASCHVTENLNGEYELNMTMFSDDPKLPFMQIGSILAVKPNAEDPIQAFCVEEMKKNLKGEIEVYATHITQFRGKLIPVENYTATSLSDALSKALSKSMETNPFSLTTDKTVATGFTLDTPRSFRELLGGVEGSLLDKYGGEYHYDNFNIELLNHRGEDNGVRIFYGKNMTEFLADDQFDWDKSATGVVPFWYSEDSGLVMGDPQYSNNVDLYPYHRTVLKDYTDDYENQPTKADLESEAASWIANKGLPMTNLSVSFDEFIADNEGKKIGLGDTVQVINSVYNVNYTSRIVKTDYDVLLERYAEIQVGDVKKTINQAIADTVIISKGSGSSITISQDLNGNLNIGI